MTVSVADIIGYNIRKFREEQKMSQSKIANKMNISRPSISSWETGKSEPSSSQLVNLAKILGVSTDTLVNNTRDPKKVIVVDTSALIRRPSICDELVEKFDEVIIPKIVTDELNDHKDHGKPSVKQKAWLAMINITGFGDRIINTTSIEAEGKNDEKIVAIAKKRAKESIVDKVYMFSEDIWFQFLVKGQNNLYPITIAQYSKIFSNIDKKFDPIQSIEFYSNVKNRNLKKIKNLIKSSSNEIDINLPNQEDGMTPLIRAVRNRDKEMIEFLTSLPNIDLDTRDKYKYRFTALHHATQLEDIELIRILVDKGADIDFGSMGRNVGNTCLMVAAWSGFTKVVEYLLSQGACRNQQDSNGYTPLIKACINHHYEIVKLLIEKTDINIRSRDNKKAIDYIKPSKSNNAKIISLFEGLNNDR
jgi:ankyrin repeat protein/transcriptional regulator with XRE-family HTH domain